MANNDDRILELKKKIKEKKRLINKNDKFIPNTNFILKLDEITYNIHTLDKEKTIHLLVKLTSLKEAFKKLKIEEEYNLSGYSIDEWIEDLKHHLNKINMISEKKKLRDLESKLDSFLSNDKRVELELDDIAKLVE